MPSYAYLFEAKSIQQWIFAGGKLSDMVAASDLLEALTGSLLDNVAKQLPANDKIEFPRRAGGTFYATADSPETLKRLRSLWNAFVDQAAPGLVWSDALVQGENLRESIKAGIQKLAELNNQPNANLPETHSLILRAPRTGKAAVKLDDRMPASEWVDEDLLARRNYRRANAQKSKKSGLELKFTPKKLQEDLTVFWPTDLQGDAGEKSFPFKGEGDLIALVHADGNGLGQILQQMDDFTGTRPEAYKELYSGFSKAVSWATETAARDATESVLVPKLQNGVFPARPLILGGDDVTVIVRGDLALDYAEAFLKGFESRSKEALARLRQELKNKKIDLPAGFPAQLYGCAGIAFIKPKQPFFLAYTLCESLCSEAKKAVTARKELTSNEKRSALSFYRLMQTTAESPADMIERETVYPAYRTGLGVDLAFRLGAYGLEGSKGLPELGDLKRLFKLSDKYPSWLTRMRETLTLAELDPDQARKQLRRWDEMTGRRLGSAEESGSTVERRDWEGFLLSMEKLVGPFTQLTKTEKESGVACQISIDGDWRPMLRVTRKDAKLMAPFSELMVLGSVMGGAQ